MKRSMQAPATPQHDLVATTAALRRALLQRVEQGIEASGLGNYFLYVVTKRLVFDGPSDVARLAAEVRQDPRAIEGTLAELEQRGMARREGANWSATAAGRSALVAANQSGTDVLADIRDAIGERACRQLVAGMQQALAALQASA